MALSFAMSSRGEGAVGHDWLGTTVYFKADLDRWDVRSIKLMPGPKREMTAPVDKLRAVYASQHPYRDHRRHALV